MNKALLIMVALVIAAGISGTAAAFYPTRAVNLSQEFTGPELWGGSGWMPLTTPWVPVGSQVRWTVTINVENVSGHPVHECVVRDQFKLPLASQPSEKTQGTVSMRQSKNQVAITWDIGTLPAGRTAVLKFEISDDPDSGDVVFAKSGMYALNDGARMKWKDDKRLFTTSVPAHFVMAAGDAGAEKPAILTEPHTDLSATSITLNSSLIDMGNASRVYISFEWGSANLAETVPVIAEKPGAYSYKLTDLTPETVYLYRAKVVGNFTSYGDYRVFTTWPSPPSTISPRDGGQVASLTPTLDWGKVRSAASYGIQVAADPDFEDFIVKIGPGAIFEDHYDMPPGKIAPCTTYYWRVMVSKGWCSWCMSEWSDASSFTTPEAEQSHATGNDSRDETPSRPLPEDSVTSNPTVLCGWTGAFGWPDTFPLGMAPGTPQSD